MKFLSVLLIGMTVLSVFADTALLQNGDFNGKDHLADITVNQDRGKIRVSKVTEDLSWNKCVKMEIAAFREKNGKKELSCGLIFGKNGKNCGVPVKPGTRYKFSLDLKGTRGVGFWVLEFDAPTTYFWKGKAIRPLPKGAAASPKAWTRVNGSFKTGPKTRFIGLKVQFWADSSQMKTMPSVGDYVMADNIRIEEQKSLETAIPAAADAAPAVPRPALTLPAETVLTLPQRKDPAEHLQLPVRITCDDQGIVFTAELPPARPGLVPVRENGMGLWKDDVVELFFAPPVKDRLYTQFAISSGGGRYRGTGQPDGKFDLWTGKTEQADGKRICTMNIPWKLIGYSSRPPAGTALGINIGIFLNKNNYAYAPVKTSFSDVDHFASIIFGSREDYLKRETALLKKDAPETLLKDIEKLEKNTEEDPGKIIAVVQTLRRKILSARMGKAPFLAARLPVTWQYTSPIAVNPEHLIREKISLTAAGNEIAMLPLAILNRTGKTAAYRVIVHADAKNFSTAERTGLGNGFPAKNITFREALPVKDSEADHPGIIYDPLPKMNEAQVIVIPPREIGIVWLEFDCGGVEPGNYPGSIRIIPLSEPAQFTNGNYKGQMRDYPLNVEVLPFKLPSPRPQNMFQQVVSREYFLMTCRLGTPALSVNSWNFRFKFDKKGDLTNGSSPAAVNAFKAAQAMFADAPEGVKPRYKVGASMYKIFKKICLPKEIKVFSPEWENCWRNYLKAFRKLTDGCGIPPEQIEIELVDEPRIKYEKEYFTMTKIAAETLPDAHFSMTWGPANFGFGAEKIAPFVPYIRQHNFHHHLLADPAIVSLLRKIQANKKLVTSVYECSTNIRELLHTYFRLHPWTARINHFDCLGFYTFTQTGWGRPGASDWKLTHLGAITYRSDDHCIPSIRMYALLQGVTDIRYWDALLPYQNDPETAAFLKTAPAEILRNRHDPEQPDRFRAGAVKLLKRLTK